LTPINRLRKLKLAVLVAGRQDVNVALNRPSYQSSVYSNAHGSHPANRANDGKLTTRLSYGSCVFTMFEKNPWWAVDLLVQLYVAGVNFTNRKHAGTYPCECFTCNL